MRDEKAMRQTKSVDLKTEKGAMLITAMVLIMLGGFAIVGAEAAKTFFQRQSRSTEIRAKMTAQESVIRLIALQPHAYQCPLQTPGQLSTFSNCRIVTDAFLSAEKMAVNGAVCPPGISACGIRLVINNEGSTAGLALSPLGRFSGTLIYEGKETRIAPTRIELDVPAEVIQAKEFDCALRDAETPIFVGFEANGQAKCVGFNKCGVGEFVREVDMKNNRVICARLAEIPGIRHTCGSQQAITTVSWSASSATTTAADIKCGPLLEAPFDWTPTTVTLPTQVNGACGASNNVATGTAPATNLCAVGVPSTVTKTSNWNWTCSGNNGGSTATCSAPVSSTLANGVCGSANGVASATAPTANLCSAGVSTAVADGTAWTWSCTGTNGGSTATCMAEKDAPKCPAKWQYVGNFGSQFTFQPAKAGLTPDQMAGVCLNGGGEWMGAPCGYPNKYCVRNVNWTAMLYKCSEDCPPPPMPTAGRWVRTGVNGATGTECPDAGPGLLLNAFQAPTQLATSCTTAGAVCTVNTAGNALAGGGGVYVTYMCIVDGK